MNVMNVVGDMCVFARQFWCTKKPKSHSTMISLLAII